MKSIGPTTGYTLLELVVVISLVAILAAMAFGSWPEVIAKSRQRSQINEYRAFFSFARWHAASMNALVTICPLDSTDTCTDDWELPVHVFVDNDRNGQPDDRTLRVLQAPDPGFRVWSRTAGTGYFRFADTGMLHGRTGGLVFCSGAASSRLVYIAINKGGRFRVEYDRDADGRIMTSSGDVISC